MEKYTALITGLLAQDKTTGDNHSEAMIHYTRMNLKRLNRWMSKGELIPEAKSVIKSIDKPQYWTVLTEAWCGDAAHALGFLWKMASLNDQIHFEWKLRDQNLDLMDQYLTNGGRSIPKLIVRNANGEDLFDWGPRPAHIQKAYLKMRENNLPYSEISIELQKLYNADKGESTQQEILALIEQNN
ncbi:MAG: thioredoxin family protein [Crocinitomicaceae bacterium]